MYNTWQKLLNCIAGNIKYDGSNYLDFGWKTTFSDLYNRILKIKRTITASKIGSKIIIHSISESEKIDNLSFIISHGSLEKSHSSDDIIFEKETSIVTIKEVLPGSNLNIYVND